MEAFGVALKRFRRLSHLTQQELAERAGYSAHYVSMLERGVRAPQPITAEILAEALDLTGDDRAELLGTSGRGKRRSVRALPGVSAPLTWQEVQDRPKPQDFTIDTMPARIAAAGDLWAKLRADKGANLLAAIEKLR